MSAAVALRAEDASAARSTQNVICIHLTPFAPGLERVGVEDKRRWKTFWNKNPAAVIRALLRQIDRRPGEIQTHTAENGDVELLITPPEELIPFQDTGEAAVPIAVIWEGLSQVQLNGILTTLRAANWAPQPIFDPDA